MFRAIKSFFGDAASTRVDADDAVWTDEAWDAGAYRDQLSALSGKGFSVGSMGPGGSNYLDNQASGIHESSIHEPNFHDSSFHDSDIHASSVIEPMVNIDGTMMIEAAGVDIKGNLFGITELDSIGGDSWQDSGYASHAHDDSFFSVSDFSSSSGFGGMDD